MRRVIILFVVALFALACFPFNTFAGSQDFTLVNKTGFDIYEVYAAPYNSNDWEEEILGDQILRDGESVDITFDGYKEAYWDLMVKDEDGNSYTWTKINLKEISRITLYYDGKDTWADFE